MGVDNLHTAEVADKNLAGCMVEVAVEGMAERAEEYDYMDYMEAMGLGKRLVVAVPS